MVWREGQHCALVALSRANILSFVHISALLEGGSGLSILVSGLIRCDVSFGYQVPWFLSIPLEYFTTQSKEHRGTGELKKRYLGVFSFRVKYNRVRRQATGVQVTDVSSYKE